MAFPNDDFESYATGDLNTLNGGTGWSEAWGATNGCNVAFDVVSTPVQNPPTGTRAVGITSGSDVTCFRKFTANTTANQEVSFYTRSNSTTLHTLTWFYGNTGQAQLLYYMRSNGQHSSYVNTTLTDLGAYSVDTFYRIRIKVVAYSPTETYQIQIEAGGYSADKAMYDTTQVHTNTDEIRFAVDTTSHTGNWDDISDATPVVGTDNRLLYLTLMGVG